MLSIRIQREFGAPSSEVFDRIEIEPTASASIGQVHRARLKNGEEAAVKILRPGIRAVIEVDLEIMLHLATLADRHTHRRAGKASSEAACVDASRRGTLCIPRSCIMFPVSSRPNNPGPKRDNRGSM